MQGSLFWLLMDPDKMAELGGPGFTTQDTSILLEITLLPYSTDP